MSSDDFEGLLDRLHPGGREGRLLDRITLLEQNCAELDELNRELYETVAIQSRVIASMRTEQLTTATTH